MSKYFTSKQRTLVTSVLGRLIPPEEDMPSAAQTGIVDYVDGVVAGSNRLPWLFAQGLRSIEHTAAQLGGSKFENLLPDRQDQVLRKVESEKSEFFELLVLYTYNGYYSTPSVVQALGLDPRPPQPRGYAVDLGDFSSLEVVQGRGQVYRDA